METTRAVQHTPGRWEWTTGDPDLRNYGIYSIEGGRIAEVHNQNSANARLIASAPELLEALGDLVDQLEGIGIPDWHGAEGLSLDKAQAALARAPYYA
jgi:hypothetical protein